MVKIDDKYYPFIKWTIYAVILLIIYAFQTTPHFLEFYGLKPIWVLSFAVCVSMYEGIFSSALFGMFAGLLWDISSDKLLGFNAIILLCCCAGISLFCTYLVRTKLINSAAFCAITVVIQALIDYLFYYAIWKYESIHLILTRQLIPNAIYTVIITVGLFYIVKFIATKFNKIVRI